MTIRNYATRTAALTALESMDIGEPILLAPYKSRASLEIGNYATLNLFAKPD
ncbi:MULTISPECIES: hypothetical protein [Citrobacter]|uniref:hypothetical protein n=1 Tax=Citrobacter TaxID=544 RepID=UPI000A7D2095|nr:MULTISPECIES: hypothetical protein [Citrobacter]MCQ6312253.1 hypothetical protein [Citrobacter portucalensis]